MNAHTKRTTLQFLVGCLVVSSMCVGVASALHRNTPVGLQVTTAPSQEIGSPSFAFNSTALLFHSDGDQLSNGNTTTQIFLFDLTPRVKRNKVGLVQLTFGQQGSWNPTSAKRGRIIAFESEADHLGNGTTGRQIFAARRVKWRRGIIPLFQVTRGAAAGTGPKLSGTGKYLFFKSPLDLTSAGLPPGPHLYRSELRRLEKSICPSYPCPFGVAPGLLLVTDVDAWNYSPDRRGDRIVFDSKDDAAGNNCTNGASQIFMKVFATGITEQLTFGAGDSIDPVFSRDGESIFFASNADLLSNGNSRQNIFRLRLKATPYLLEQITFGTDGDSFGPEPNGRRGNRVFFRSDANLTGAAAGITRVYLWDADEGPVRITSNENIDSPHTAQFLFTAFVSDSDLLGTGNSSPQLFLVNTFPLLQPPPNATPVPSPTPTTTPVPGKPANIGLALVSDIAGDNGDATLTTVIAGLVSDVFGTAVPDGTMVDFRVLAPTNGAVVSNGMTGMDPLCDIAAFEAVTGIPVLNQPGVAHVCLTYAGAHAGSDRAIQICAGGTDERRCTGGSTPDASCLVASDCDGGSCDLVEPPICTQQIVTLPLAPDGCTTNGQPCTDSNPCTVDDVCAGGLPGATCSGGANLGGACTLDTDCPDLQQCLNGPNHGNVCTGSINCPDGICALTSTGACALTTPPTCQSGAPVVCSDDGNLCTSDVCDPFTGACNSPTFCANDDNPCTNDVCNMATGNCGVPNSDPCDDGDICTIDDVCVAGVCGAGPPLSCPDDINPCTTDVCNPDTGTCGIPIACVCP